MQISGKNRPQLIDVSHVVEDGMITYKGLPAPIICDYLTRADSEQYYGEGTTFHIGKLEMVANTGTYIDAPFHRYAEGKDMSELDLSCLANLEAIVFRIDPATRAIGRELFGDRELAGKLCWFIPAGTGIGARTGTLKVIPF